MLRQSYLGDWSDPVLDDDVVQPSNESRRTAPPEESAADHTVHVEERDGGSFKSLSYDQLNVPE